MLKLENSIRGLSFSRVAFDLTIQETEINVLPLVMPVQSIKYDTLVKNKML